MTGGLAALVRERAIWRTEQLAEFGQSPAARRVFHLLRGAALQVLGRPIEAAVHSELEPTQDLSRLVVGSEKKEAVTVGGFDLKALADVARVVTRRLETWSKQGYR